MPYVRLYAMPSPRPSLAHKPDHAAAKRELEKFVATVKKAVSAARHHTAAAAANTVVVDRTGKSFPTIGAALDSITDATEQKEYVVSAGPGTYNEVVTCKPWVFLTGAGRDQTVITAVSAPSPNQSGTVKAASNSAVQNCAIRGTATATFGAYVTAVNCQGVVNFDVENCELFVTGTNQMNLVAFMIDFVGSGKSGSQVNIAYTTVTAKEGASPLALSTGWYTYVHATESRFIAQGGNQPWGCATIDQSVMLVENCYVEGADYSLWQDDTGQTTANQCQLVGPVAPGVVVNN